MRRRKKKFTEKEVAKRKRIEEHLSQIPVMPEEARKLLSNEGFIDYFWRMRDLYDTYKNAYERLEVFYIEIFGHRKYSDYDSFRTIVARFRIELPED